jgi:hypothetical protein
VPACARERDHRIATSSRDNRSSGSDDRKVVVLDLLGRTVDDPTNPTQIDHAPTDVVPEDFSQGDQLVAAFDLFRDGTKVGEETPSAPSPA